MKSWLLLWILVWNGIAFVLMGLDKGKAKEKKWLIPEKVLFLAAALGGSIGAMLGMSFFRHKTKHWSFRLGMPAILAVQIVLLLVLSFRTVLFP